MRILVCIKQVPDTAEVALTEEMTLERSFTAQVMNPADESALELALRLRDEQGGTVTVLTMGPARAETMLRETLARGVHEAVLLTDRLFAGSDSLVTARFLAQAAQRLGGFDLILCGRRAADGETGQVGPMLAVLLGIPCLPNVIHTEVAAHTLTARQLTEAGTTTWEAGLPALITLCEWSYHLRLPTIMGMRRARNAAVTTLTAANLGVVESGLQQSPTRVIRADARPQGVRPCRILPLAGVLTELNRQEVLP